MLIQIYSPLNAGDTFQGNKLGDIKKVSSYSYTKGFYTVGKFNLRLATNTLFADKITTDTLLFIENKLWFIVDKVIKTQTEYRISGTDLKGFLKQRITLFDVNDDDSVQGYDVIQGSTETVLKHYINGNIVNPSNSKRKIQGFTVATDQCRGLTSDSYMSRFDRLDELAETVCKNANVGYDVTADLVNNCFIFDLIEVTDKTASQSVNNRVIFAVNRGNVLSLVREYDKTSYKNTFYATKGGETLETDATTVLTYRDGETEAKGYLRREVQVNVSCDSVSEISTYASKEMENYIATDTFEAEINNVSEYGSIYNIGDKVTVTDGENELDSIITEVSVENDNISIVFGDKKPKVLTALNKKINNKGV